MFIISRLTGYDPERPAQTVTIRKDSSLLLGSGVQDGTLLEIDVDGDGVYDLSGAPTDTFPVLYSQYGTYEVKTRIDGVESGILIVDVPQVIFPKNVACEIGFTRELTVGIPEESASDIIFSALDSTELTIHFMKSVIWEYPRRVVVVALKSNH